MKRNQWKSILALLFAFALIAAACGDDDDDAADETEATTAAETEEDATTGTTASAGTSGGPRLRNATFPPGSVSRTLTTGGPSGSSIVRVTSTPTIGLRTFRSKVPTVRVPAGCPSKGKAVPGMGIAGPAGRVETLDVDGWQRCVDVNLNGTCYVTRQAIPLLKKSDTGAIISVSSNAGLMGCPDRSQTATN